MTGTRRRRDGARGRTGSLTDGQAAPIGRPNLAAKLRSTRTDFLGFRHSLLGMLCGAAGLLAAAALLFKPPHATLVSLAGTVLLPLFGVDTVHASLTRPRGTDERPAPTQTPSSPNQTLPINRGQMVVYVLVSVAVAAAGAALASDTAGAVKVLNLAVAGGLPGRCVLLGRLRPAGRPRLSATHRPRGG